MQSRLNSDASSAKARTPSTPRLTPESAAADLEPKAEEREIQSREETQEEEKGAAAGGSFDHALEPTPKSARKPKVSKNVELVQGLDETQKLTLHETHVVRNSVYETHAVRNPRYVNTQINCHDM